MLPLKVLAKMLCRRKLENRLCNPDGGSSSGSVDEVEKLMSSVELQNQSFASSPLEAK
jgi:hypothetical protein